MHAFCFYFHWRNLSFFLFFFRKKKENTTERWCFFGPSPPKKNEPNPSLLSVQEAIGAKCIDLEWVQVHPTGLVKPDDADAKIKFLAAEDGSSGRVGVGSGWPLGLDGGCSCWSWLLFKMGKVGRKVELCFFLLCMVFAFGGMLVLELEMFMLNLKELNMFVDMLCIKYICLYTHDISDIFLYLHWLSFITVWWWYLIRKKDPTVGPHQSFSFFLPLLCRVTQALKS